MYNDYERCLMEIVSAYEMEDYDCYDFLIEDTARKFGMTYNQVEDDATDVRLFGIDGN